MIDTGSRPRVVDDWYRFPTSNKCFVEHSSKIFEDLCCNSVLHSRSRMKDEFQQCIVTAQRQNIRPEHTKFYLISCLNLRANLYLWFINDTAADLIWLKFKLVSFTLKSTWNGAICSLNMSKCLISKSWPSAFDFAGLLPIDWAALEMDCKQADNTS